MIPCQVRGCRNIIEYNGALLFSPPDNNSNCEKIHICQICYPKLIQGLLNEGIITRVKK